MAINAQIKNFVLQELESHPEGIRFSELKKLIIKEFPKVPGGTIAQFLVTDWKKTENIVKPIKGLFILKKYNKANSESPVSKTNDKEVDFYEPFAEYLKNDLEDCTEAIPLGGNSFGDKWGTPDVIGVVKPSPSDIIKEYEFISAEIKLDTNSNSLIIGFGQASAYKLFSHKVYLVIPEQSSKADTDRLESLSCLFGIGLITFDKNDSKNPNFKIRNRASKISPDLFYLKEKIKLVADKLKW